MMEAGGQAGYAPGKSVIPVLERVRDGKLPQPLTAESVMRMSVTTESLAPRVIQSLKLLDVIDDDGMLTPTASKFSELSTPDYKPTLRDLLKRVYSDVFAVTEPSTATYEEIQDAFRAYVPKGQRDRMVSLFLNLLEYAEYSDTLPKARASLPPKIQRNAGTSGNSGGGSAAGNAPRRRSSTSPIRQPATPPVREPSIQKAPPGPSGTRTVVRLGEAGTVTLIADVDPWKLRGEHRTFFNDLQDAVVAHQEAYPTPPAETDEAAEDHTEEESS